MTVAHTLSVSVQLGNLCSCTADRNHLFRMVDGNARDIPAGALSLVDRLIWAERLMKAADLLGMRGYLDQSERAQALALEQVRFVIGKLEGRE